MTWVAVPRTGLQAPPSGALDTRGNQPAPAHRCLSRRSHRPFVVLQKFQSRRLCAALFSQRLCLRPDQDRDLLDGGQHRHYYRRAGLSQLRYPKRLEAVSTGCRRCHRQHRYPASVVEQLFCLVRIARTDGGRARLLLSRRHWACRRAVSAVGTRQVHRAQFGDLFRCRTSCSAASAARSATQTGKSSPGLARCRCFLHRSSALGHASRDTGARPAACCGAVMQRLAIALRDGIDGPSRTAEPRCRNG